MKYNRVHMKLAFSFLVFRT